MAALIAHISIFVIEVGGTGSIFKCWVWTPWISGKYDEKWFEKKSEIFCDSRCSHPKNQDGGHFLTQKQFFVYNYENYWSGWKMFVHKVRELEKCYLFFFLTNFPAPKLWKLWAIIDLGRVSRTRFEGLENGRKFSSKNDISHFSN